MSVEVEIKSDDEVVYPAELAIADVSLLEIGAIFCVAALPHLNKTHPEQIGQRIQTPEMIDALKSLKAKGVFSVEVEGKSVSMKVDLDKILPSAS